MSESTEQALVTVNPADLARAAWQERTDEIVNGARQYVLAVTDERTCDIARRAKKAADQQIKELSKHRRSITDPANAVIKQIIAQEKLMIADLISQRDRVKKLAADYATRIEQERQAAERARQEAERQAAEQAYAAQQAAEKAAEDARAAGEDVPVPVPAPAPMPAPQPAAAVAPPKPRGTVTVDHHEVTDITQVPREFLVVDDAKVRAYAKYARSVGQDPRQPGIRFWQTQDVR